MSLGFNGGSPDMPTAACTGVVVLVRDTLRGSATAGTDGSGAFGGVERNPGNEGYRTGLATCGQRFGLGVYIEK